MVHLAVGVLQFELIQTHVLVNIYYLEYLYPSNIVVHIFIPFVGQVACRSCGSSSRSAGDRTTCLCIGTNRTFLPLTGACVCESGYSFFDEAGQDDSNADSPLDCQPTVSLKLGTSDLTYKTL